jgi:hypothetical protein
VLAQRPAAAHAGDVNVPVLLALTATAVAAVVVGLTLTAWALLALPVCLVGGYAAWLGLDLDRFLSAVTFPDEDTGRGPAGMLP